MNLSETQWKIIELLSEADKTLTEIAKILKISLPGAYHHLSFLKQRNIIQESEKAKGKTRPYSTYSLKQGFIYFIKAIPGETERKLLEVDEDLLTHLRIWSLPQKEFHYYLEKVHFLLQDNNILAWGVYGSVARGEARKDSDIDILILAEKKNKSLQEFEAKPIKNGNNQKIIMAQLFFPEELEKSLKSGSRFVSEALRDLKIIYDPEKILQRFKHGFKKKEGDRIS